MGALLIAVIYLIFISLGLPDSLLGSGWPVMQMASAYTGSTLMPMLFGQFQQNMGITVLPVYILIFSLLNIVFIEWAYRKYKTANS